MSIGIRLPKQAKPGDIEGDNVLSDVHVKMGEFGLTHDKGRVIWQLIDAAGNTVASISFCPDCAFATASRIALSAGVAIGIEVPTLAAVPAKGGLH